MTAPLRVVYSDEALVLAHLDAVMLTLVRENLRAHHYSQVHRLMQELVRKHDGRMASIVTVRSRLHDLPRVDDDQRRMAREIMVMGGARTLGAVAAIEGGGFWAAGVRSILTGICLLARPAFPWRIVEGQRDAARWLAARWPEPGGEAALLAALDEMGRAGHTAHAPLAFTSP